jgi:hypothetical protein
MIPVTTSCTGPALSRLPTRSPNLAAVVVEARFKAREKTRSLTDFGVMRSRERSPLRGAPRQPTTQTNPEVLHRNARTPVPQA